MTNKALRVEIYTNCYKPSELNAVSFDNESALLLCDEGPIEVTDQTEEPVLKLVERRIGGRFYKHVEPVAKCPPDRNGWMASGTFVYTPDSRFPNDYPLSLHDRAEVIIND